MKSSRSDYRICNTVSEIDAFVPDTNSSLYLSGSRKQELDKKAEENDEEEEKEEKIEEDELEEARKKFRDKAR